MLTIRIMLLAKHLSLCTFIFFHLFKLFKNILYAFLNSGILQDFFSYAGLNNLGVKCQGMADSQFILTCSEQYKFLSSIVEKIVFFLQIQISLVILGTYMYFSILEILVSLFSLLDCKMSNH